MDPSCRVVEWVTPDNEKTGSKQPSNSRGKKATKLSPDKEKPLVAVVSPDRHAKRMVQLEPTADISVAEDHLSRSVSCLSLREKAKWEPLLRSKDELLQQKDLIIARQRKVIERLQLESQEMESQLNRAYMAAAQDDLMTVQFQEHQCEVASLKASLSDVRLGRKRDVQELQRKLGETEHEYEKLQMALQATSDSMSADIAALRKNLQEREEAFQSMARSNEHLAAALKEAEEKHAQYETYISRLPTEEEHEKKEKDVSRLQSQCQHLQDIITKQEVELHGARQQQETMESERDKLQKQINALLTDGRRNGSNDSGVMESNHEREGNRDLLRVEAERDHLLKLLQDTKVKGKAHSEGLKQRFKERYTEATDMLKSRLQKSRREASELRERLQQEEDTVTALRASCAVAEEDLMKSKTSLKTLTENNQELLEQTLTLQDQITMRTSQTDENARNVHLVAMKLHSLMSYCVQELKDLVDCGLEIAAGKDPNISTLLGTSKELMTTDRQATPEVDPAVALQELIGNAEHFRRDIERLRTFIRDTYAEHMGRTAVCTVQ